MEDILDYLQASKKLPKPVARVLARKICKYPDIMQEFGQYISTGNYPEENAVSIRGYTAKKVHETVPFLDETGVYSFLVTARDDPRKAESYIINGFPRK